jgi:hypothetical protein
MTRYSTSTTFEQAEREELWRRLEHWQNNTDQKVTREAYLEICRQTGEEPDPWKIPPEIEDFPEDVQKAINVFNRLGDKIVPDVGYLGKDYTSLPLHIEIMKPDSKEIFLETLLKIDERLIKQSAETMRQEREKLERKMKSK